MKLLDLLKSIEEHVSRALGEAFASQEDRAQLAKAIVSGASAAGVDIHRADVVHDLQVADKVTHEVASLAGIVGPVVGAFEPVAIPITAAVVGATQVAQAVVDTAIDAAEAPTKPL